MKDYSIATIALIISWILGGIFTKFLIPFLKKHQFKQYVREVGPKAHLSKTGTPSMGGIAIVSATVISALVISLICGYFTIGIAVCLLVMVLFAVIGFIDDYEKAIKKNNAGISPKQKIIMQFGFSAGFAIFAYFFSGNYMTSGNFVTLTGEVANSAIWIPVWDKYIDLGIWYIPFIIFVMVAFSNSVNLTDGLDGLASGITALVGLCMVIIGVAFGYLDQPIVFGAVSGACLGFLLFNKNPAKIFMGDTGSMALGGVLAASAVMMKLEFILAAAGLIYVIEAISVIIQVGYFKLTNGKRFFKMAPIHHHFELCGMREKNVVYMFWTWSLLLCISAIVIANI